jgi:prepilin-type N-terminal cleavage/methylation domain-containing protein
MQRTPSSHSAFTLTELLVVLVITGVLIGLTTMVISWAMHSVGEVVDEVAAAQIPHMRRQAKAQGSRAYAEARNRYLFALDDSTQNVHAEIARINRLVPLEVTHVYNNAIKGFAARVAPAMASRLVNLRGVKYVEPDVVAHSAAQKIPTGLKRIHALQDSVMFGSHLDELAPRNLAISVVRKDLTQVVVAVLDSGVDKTHPDLNVEFSKAFGTFNDLDVFGHGTSVAGIIGARNNNIGTVGVCPGCRIWNLKVSDATGASPAADVLAGLDFVANRARTINVANMSLSLTKSTAINDAVTNCWNLGVIMVVAAGNELSQATKGVPVDATKVSPASASGAICVGGLADSDGKTGGLGPKCSNGDDDDTMDFNFGPRIDFLAPAVDIYTTAPVAMGSYTMFTGTSAAAPYVAGLAALAISPLPPDGPIRNLAPIIPAPGRGVIPLTPAQVKDILLDHSPYSPPSQKAFRIRGPIDMLTHPVINASMF